MDLKRLRRQREAERRATRQRELTRDQRKGIAEANAVGLYLLIETAGRGRERWVVYDRTTGRELISWWPATGRYTQGDTIGTLGSFREVLDLLGR
jgi:hypothetical protein